MWKKSLIAAVIAAACLAGTWCLPLSAATASAEGTDGVLMKAMRDGMERSMSKLEIEELGKPYFISYRIDDIRSLNASASFGSLLSSHDGHRRTLTVELRVGGYDFDNTNFLTLPSFNRSMMVRSFGGVTPLPLDDDYRELRRQIWLSTDSAYKEALENLAKKKAALQNKTRTEDLPDFSRAEATEIRDDRPAAEADLAAMEGLVTRLSALFREMPDVYTSRADYAATNGRSLYLNSEGTSYSRTDPRVSLSVAAATQADDGMALEDFVSAYGRRTGDLPSEAELTKQVKVLGERLGELRSAALLDRYNGPVLFAGQAAAELFAQAFAPKLAAQRRLVFADERMAQFAARNEGSDFQDRLGARVLPRFLSVTDDPTAEAIAGSPLHGGYEVDFEGVAAGKTPIIERGYLKTLLIGRSPVEGVAASSGNMSRGGVSPSNLVVATDRGSSDDELMEELKLLIADREAEFGILVRRLGNPMLKAVQDPFRGMSRGGGGQETPVEAMTEAYKVYPDGREELLRNVEISGLSPASFKEIVAAGAEPTVYSLPYMPRSSNPFMRGAGGGPAVVTMAVPALLFEELSLKKPSGEIPKLPVAPHPAFAE